MREFVSSAKRHSAVDNDTPIPFMLNGQELVANAPGSGQLAVFLATQASGDPGDVAKATLELMAAILGDQYPWFESCLKDGSVEMELVMEMIEFFTEEWSSVPTTCASASSRRSAVTGKRSTAKLPSKA